MMVFQRGQTIALALGFFTLCVTIYIETVKLREGQQIDLANRVAAPFHTGVVLSAEPINRRDIWLTEIMSRPLFSPNRRPTENTDFSVAGLPRLTAIVIDGPRQVAIFADLMDSHVTVVRAGSRIGTYDVRDIAESGVTVMGPKGLIVLHPTFNSAPPAAPAAAQKVVLPSRPPFLVPRNDEAK
jgi:hypothetical protein